MPSTAIDRILQCYILLYFIWWTLTIRARHRRRVEINHRNIREWERWHREWDDYLRRLQTWDGRTRFPQEPRKPYLE